MVFGSDKKADLAAKAALNLSSWQDEWNNVEANRLRFFKPNLGDWQSSYIWSRRDKVVLPRSSIGHVFDA